MRLDTPYFGILGVAFVAVGIASLLLGVTGGTFELGLMAISGPFSIWRGAVVLAAGGFYLRAINGGLEGREDEAMVFMGSLMIWIVGGMEVLSILLGAVPGSPEVWIASPAGFLSAVAPPYPPSVLALVVSLPALRYTEERVPALVGRLLMGRD